MEEAKYVSKRIVSIFREESSSEIGVIFRTNAQALPSHLSPRTPSPASPPASEVRVCAAINLRARSRLHKPTLLSSPRR